MAAKKKGKKAPKKIARKRKVGKGGFVGRVLTASTHGRGDGPRGKKK